jgi:cephalosporin-C deacetylase-like acetyl esterase
MDLRGQGGGRRGADTPDPADGGAPASPGFLTRGIADPRTHDYTRLVVVTGASHDVRPYRELIDFCSVHSDRIDEVFATLSYPEEISVYPFNGHEGGGTRHLPWARVTHEPGFASPA